MKFFIKAPFKLKCSRLIFKFSEYLKVIVKVLKLSERNYKWISFASILFLIIFTLAYIIFLFDSLSFIESLLYGSLILIPPLIIGLLTKLGIEVVKKIPKQISWVFYTAVSVFFIYSFASVEGILIQIFYFFLSIIFLFGAVSNLNRCIWKKLSKLKKIINIFFLSLGICNLLLLIYFLFYPGPEQDQEFLNAVFLPQNSKLPDPSGPGDLQFSEIFYGAGKNKQRREFRGEKILKSYTVDASSFIDNWDKLPGKMRSFYWGFGPDSLPLNGRMWLPEGAGPFPIAIMVHGNHLDRDFSDPGYSYIGKHMASLGYIAVSVDENFLNGGLLNFNHPLEDENDARAWLLLKHLELFSTWNIDSLSGLYGKVDLNNVILIGHSRGGEAVAIASCFNKLPYYPDNAEEAFDFNFGIKGIVAIAPIDGQYYPSDIPTPVSNVNYLVLQGSMDADLNSYSGLRQYNRISFTDSAFHFKAGCYMQGVNHGQFNTSWGRNDIGYPNGLFLNRRSMLEKKEQEKISLVYISAFIKTCFSPTSGYLDFFKDYRNGREWLPETGYLNQYQDSEMETIADYEEDLDISTSSNELMCMISFSDLATIYEKKLELNKGNSGTKSLVIGWNNQCDSLPGYYEIKFTNPLNMHDEKYRILQFDLAVMKGDPGERIHIMDVKNISTNTLNYKQQNNNTESKLEKNEMDGKIVDFTLALSDVNGNITTILLSDYFPLNPPIVSKIYKLEIFNKQAEPEIIPQHIELKINNFLSASTDFFADSIYSIKFVFSEGEKGLMAIDNIAFHK